MQHHAIKSTIARPLVSLFALGMLTMIGCEEAEDGPELLPVTGTVKFKNNPVGGARVTYYPTDDTVGFGGSARTNDDGTYSIVYQRGGEGLPAGSYKVTISKATLPDGSEEAEDVSPIESQAVERLPPRYSSEDSTILSKTVGTSGNDSFDFDLK